jgi:signal transduction histidine kinase/ActR/RegA family two-component response regulator
MAIGNSIARRMLAVILATTFVALLLTGVALLAYDARTYQAEWVGDLAAQADILARASAPALAFNDEKAARENLLLLQLRPGILSGAIYTADGAVFASYIQPGAQDVSIPPLAHRRGHVINNNQIEVAQEIRDHDDLVGFVVLRGRYELTNRLINYAVIFAVVMVASLLLAALLALRLQRRITQPIESVTRAARHVIDTRDFSLRVHGTTQDEIGTLVDSFNAMLAEVGRRAAALEESNRTLQHEMTERRSAEEALRLADRRKDEFLATLAHELRNPLAPLRNGLEILRLKGNDAPSATRVREMMERQLNQMVRLVDDLLDVSRITTGRLKLQCEPVSLIDALNSAVETARPIIESKQHVLRVDLTAAEGVTLNADPTRLAQVFSNLLNNAARYTHNGGEIRLEARVAEDEALIAVSDNGIGISPDSMREIFGMFIQVDRSLERTNAGLGVGLSLAKRLIELHGGSIEAHSAGLSQGSEFIVRLPINAASTPSAKSPSISMNVTSSRRIIVADDNVDFATGLAVILRQAGHEVSVAHDGVAALALARDFPAEFAFIDIGMPALNGYDVARTLKRTHPHMILIAVTGWGQENDRALAREAGFDHHLVKPVDFNRLNAILGVATSAVHSAESDRTAAYSSGSSTT